jgi:plastocyanin
VGTPSQLTAAATFKVQNFIFDYDGNTATKVDTARIQVGQSVLWQWISGIHTITNGTGAADPNAGLLFDQPSDPSNTQFSFAFNTAGTYPFFCQYHESLTMKGVVIVHDATTPVKSMGWGAVKRRYR